MNKKQFLAMSLPHKLKCKRTFFDEEELGKENGICEIDGFDYSIYKEGGIFDLTPICHPLSDLTKPIEHNGETFVPIVELAKMRSSYLHESDFEKAHGKLKMDIVTKRLPFDMMKKKLTSWHFNLMDESEPFIDVNTLEINPYK